MSIQIPWASILGLLFITLKLTNHIDWSWWWVLSPFWISLILTVVLIIGVSVAEAVLGDR